MSLKLYSDIYPPDIKPVRDGWYLTSARKQWCTIDLGDFMWWDRGNWKLTADAYPLSFASARYWRGLAFNPDAAEPMTCVSSDRPSGVFLSGAEVE